MTDANPSRLAAQEARQALSDELDRHLIASMRQRDVIFMTDQDKIAHAIAAYEEARMGPKPKPKFILQIDGNHFHAKRSRAGFIDVVFVAIASATWLGLLFSIYLVFK